jgi:hypothetical protein
MELVNMSYVYAKVDDLDGKPLVGSKQCVAIVQVYANAPNTSQWTQGVQAKGNTQLAKGTALATFVDGKYPNLSHGNHAALYVSQDASGIWVMDQWAGDAKKPTISKRRMKFKGMSGTSYVDPSNNGDAMYVIE